MVKVMRADELKDGEMRTVDTGAERLLLVRVDGLIAAFADRCPHRGVPLSEGELAGPTLRCAAHGWTFDAISGRAKAPKGGACLAKTRVRIEDGVVLVGDPEREESAA